MRAQELLETLTDDELREKADACFIQAENTEIYQHVGVSKVYQPINAAVRQRLLAEAEFYLKALASRSDARTAGRDFWMEVAVIVLIGVEIILSIVFGFLAIRDARDQATLLAHMDSSTAATATAMSAVSKSLQSLADAQAESAQRLKEMNDKLQASLTTTGTMASTTRKQLTILEQEQAARAAELARKPKLNLYMGHVPLVPRPNTPRPLIYPVREETDTSTTFDADLVNEGSAPATKPLVRVILFAAPDVLFQPSGPSQRLAEPPSNPLQTYLMPIDTIRPSVDVRMTLSFSFPKAQVPFQVLFNVDADEIQSGTPLGVLTVTPRKPVNDEQPPHR